MLSRRVVLTSLAALLAAPVPALRPWRHVRRFGNVFLVDGWILTAADLRELDRHAG